MIIAISLYFLTAHAAPTFHVTFLPQTHAGWSDDFDEIDRLPVGNPRRFHALDRVLLSQLKIWRYLHAHPGAVVFKEGLDQSYYLAAAHPLWSERLREASEGPPRDINFLSQDQRWFLYHAGAPLLAFAAGAVSSLRKTHPLFTSQTDRHRAVIRRLDELRETPTSFLDDLELMRYIRDERERVVLREIAWSPLEPNDTIVLVYGANHDFQKYSSDLFEFSIPAEFRRCNEDLVTQRRDRRAD